MRALMDVIQNRMLPHFFAVLQLMLLIMGVMPFANFPVVVTGSKANGALKVIMPFPVWVLVLSITLFALFYRIREKGLEERCIFLASMLAALFSFIDFTLHFIDDLLSWMWATGNIATTLYLTASIISLYKVAVTFMVPFLKKVWKARQGISNLP